MSTVLFLNNYQTTLGAALSSTATTMTVSSTTGLPSSLASGQFIPMTLTPASNPGSAYEIVYVTGISGSSLTVTRGEEGTSALNWNTGDILYSTNTAQTTGTSMGSPSTDFQTNTLTASGLITANDGIDVTGGTLTASGLITANKGVTGIQVSSISALESFPVPTTDGLTMQVLGYSSEGDGGEGVFFWNASSTATADGATIVIPTGYTGTGRWQRLFEGTVNVLWWGADKTGTNDSSTAIQNAHNFAAANHFLKVYFPPGSYLTNTTIDWSPYVQGWTDGDVYWSTSSTTNTMMIYISSRWGDSSNAGFTVPAVFSGKFHFKQTGTNTSLACLYVGDATSGSGYGATNITFSHLQIDSFEYGIQYGNTAYMVNFNHCYLMDNVFHVYTAASLTDTGERMSFTDCTLTGATSNVISLNSSIEVRFDNCSIDYNSAIGSNFAGSKLYFSDCHIEWNEANTLLIDTGSTLTTVIVFEGCLLNFAGNVSPANPLIAEIGPYTFCYVSNPVFELADTGLTLFNIAASTGTFFGPSIYPTPGDAPGTYVANTGAGTLHTF